MIERGLGGVADWEFYNDIHRKICDAVHSR